VLVMGGAALAVPARIGAGKLGLVQKKIVELVPHAASNTMRLVERVIWVAR
jgi:hypothetical protein